MPDAGVIVELRRRFLEAACEHSNLQAAMYVGRRDAFPADMLYDGGERVNWALGRPSGRKPISIHREFFGDRVQIIAFFGDRKGLTVFRQLSRAAIDSGEEYATPEGWQQTEDSHPEAAWLHWLFAISTNPRERFGVWWHEQVNGGHAKVELSDEEQEVDPFKDTFSSNSQKIDGFRRWGCLAQRFRRSIFVVSADALAGCTRSEGNDPDAGPTWDANAEARNKWIYDECMKKTPYKKIIRNLTRRPDDWDSITTVNGIKAAAERYAKAHQKPLPPKRQRRSASKQK